MFSPVSNKSKSWSFVIIDHDLNDHVAHREAVLDRTDFESLCLAVGKIRGVYTIKGNIVFWKKMDSAWVKHHLNATNTFDSTGIEFKEACKRIRGSMEVELSRIFEVRFYQYPWRRDPVGAKKGDPSRWVDFDCGF